MFVYAAGMSKGDQKRFQKLKSKHANDMNAEAHKRKMAELNQTLVDIRKRYKGRLAEQKTACSAEYAQVAREAEEAYRAAHAKLLAVRRDKKNLKKQHCAIERELIKEQQAEEQAVAEAGRDEEIRYWKELQGIEAANKARTKERSTRSTARQRRQESDGEVESNIEPHLIPVWQKVKRWIKGNDRRSRTEEFLEWVEASPDEVRAYLAEEAEKETRRFERKHSTRARKATRQQHQAADEPDPYFTEDPGEFIPY